MEFLKKNYEKVVLVVVLLGLTVAACLLPFIISGKRADLEAKRVNIRADVKPLVVPSMTEEEDALKRAQTPLVLDYTNKHNLLNPVLWKRNPDGRLIKETAGPVDGVAALIVTNIKPLYLIITYDATSGSGYMVTIDRQAVLSESKRHAQGFVSKETKGGLLTLKAVNGPPEKPTELVLELNEKLTESGNTVSLSPDKPYKEIEGYAADLKYPPEPGKVWTDQRVGSRHLFFAGGYYKIVAITESNVVVLAESNNKKTTITLHPATEPR